MIGNTCIFRGRLTRDPELRYTPNNNAVADFGLAVDTSRKKEGDAWKTVAEFLDFTIWGKQAENLTAICKKGDLIAVRGSAMVEAWTDNEGKKRSKVKFRVDEFETIMSKKREPGDGDHGQQADLVGAIPSAPGDIPF